MPTAADKRAAREAAIRATNDDAMSDPGSVASARGEIAQPSVAGAKVVVACKIGVPYIDLQICEMVSVREQSLTGEREIIQARRTGSVVRIRGTAYPRGAMPSEFPAPPVIVGGEPWFGLYLIYDPALPQTPTIGVIGVWYYHEPDMFSIEDY